MIFVFTLSHEQAQIEQGFNINADLLVENLTSPLIVAQKRVYDHLSVTKSSPHGCPSEHHRRDKASKD